MPVAGLISLILQLWLFWAGHSGSEDAYPGRAVPRQAQGILVTTNQLLSPVGFRLPLAGSPVDLAVSPDGQTVAVSIAKRVELYSVSGQLLRSIQLPGPATYAGLAFSPDGRNLAVSHASGVTIVSLSDRSSATIALSDTIPCGLAFDPARQYLYVALNSTNRVARVDLGMRQVTAMLPVGVAPVGVAITPAADRLFVTNWGGRLPSSADVSASSLGTRVVVDSRGIAASGTVSAVALDTFAVLTHIEVGLHPSGIQVSPDGALVAVANANSDSVSLIDPTRLSVVDTVAVSAIPGNYIGSSPTAVAFNKYGSRLYVACGGNNAVAALARRNGSYEVDALAPTDWYPVAVAVGSTPGGEVVLVANAKGIGARSGLAPYSVRSRVGTLGGFDPAELVNARTLFGLNDPFRATPRTGRQPGTLGRLGIEHVFLIIKENRTYDQILGDLGSGNGDPGLALYGAAITPNHHQLASQFVTLDNFYATGTVSADGHQWITQAMATDYVERSYSAGWPRTYPSEGQDPLAFSPAGFLWDNALRNGLSVRIFGEFTLPALDYTQTWEQYLQDSASAQLRYSTPSSSPVSPLNGIIERGYPSFALNVPDQFRARIFLDRFRRYVTDGNLPNLLLIRLPSDHTAGTNPGYPSPASMVADNDLALGRIVDAISNSPYWPQSVVFAVEDDAQDGVDHVDGHRTVCLVAGPYIRRGVVDSVDYNQTSLVRTIEELLGLPPMNKFDAAALPMRSVFMAAPDLSPFYSVPARIPLAQKNPAIPGLRGAQRRDALASSKMDFSNADAAPEQQLNRILWHAARGWSKPYPKIPHQANCQPIEDEK